MVTAQQLGTANIQQVQQMVWAMFAQQTESWPQELKQALANLEVNVVRQRGQILILTKTNPGVEGNANVEKTKELILDALMGPLPQVIGAFKCKVKVFK